MKKVTCIRPVWQLAELEGDLFNRRRAGYPPEADHLRLPGHDHRRGAAGTGGPADRAHLRAGWPGWSTREESACNAAAARGDKRKGFTEADYARAARCRTPAARGPLVVVWDNLNTHVSGAMGERVAARDWLRVYQLPPYVHELNPVDGVREGWAAWDHHAGRRLGGGQVGGVRAELGPEGAFQDFVQHPPGRWRGCGRRRVRRCCPATCPGPYARTCWLIPTRPR